FNVSEQLEGFSIGSNELRISESQLKVLLDDRLPDLTSGELYVDVAAEQIKFYWDVTPGDEQPLWAVVNMKVDDQGQLYMAEVGTERVKIPQFLTNLLSGAVLSLGNVTGNSLDGTGLIKQVLPFADNVVVESVELNRDELVILLDIRTGLEDILTGN